MFNRDEIDKLTNRVNCLEDEVKTLEKNTIVYEKIPYAKWEGYCPTRIPINDIVNAILLHLKLDVKKVYQHENVTVKPIGKQK